MQVMENTNITVDSPKNTHAPSLSDFQVGTRLQLFTYREVKPVEHFSTLIGYLKDEYVICKTPIRNSASMSFHDGEKVSVRGFTGTKIYTFETSVIRTLPHPLSYMHLDFPYQIKEVGLRGAARVKVNIPVQICVSKVGEPVSMIAAWMTNLSLTGAAIESTQNLGTEQLLQLSFVFEYRGQETKINAGALVRNVNRRFTASSEAQHNYIYGVEFLGLDPKEVMQLKLWIYELLLTNRQNIV